MRVNGAGHWLEVVRPDGGGRRRLVALGEDHALDLAWSPDGTQIAFYREPRGDVWVVRRDGSGLRRMVGAAGTVERRPAWSSNGARIAFLGDWGGQTAVFVMQTAGGTAKRVTDQVDFVDPFHRPAWSRDGRRLFYGSVARPRLKRANVRPGGGAPARARPWSS